jgi:host factor-I protein
MELSPRNPGRGGGETGEKPGPSIQDTFLNAARREHSFVTIYLVSGVKLTGRIKSFDKYALVLEGGNQEQLIYKHAISTVVLQRMHLAHAAAPAATATATADASAPATDNQEG